MKQRITGFDLARAYAIFGMYIVNFNFSFGGFNGTALSDRFMGLFVGNSTSIFIILAGMGLSFMCHGKGHTATEKKYLRAVVLKRSWFLFGIGLLLYPWWPGDILHFYGGYMHVAAFLLFIPKRHYLIACAIVIVIYHLLLLVIPVNAGWDFSTTRYVDFWTPKGFLRNALYNGWNSMFPWIAYFLLGMWLGRLDWKIAATKKNVLLAGAFVFIVFQLVRLGARSNLFGDRLTGYIMSEYFPPSLPFMAITAGFALIVISLCMYIGEQYAYSKVIGCLAAVGRMTLSHYIIHLTLGMLVLSVITGKPYTGYWLNGEPTPSAVILPFAVAFFLASVLFSAIWSKRFKHGPIETLMRKFSG